MKERGEGSMGKKPFRRMFSLLLMFLLIADLSSAAFASTPEAEPANVRLQAIDVGNTAPAIPRSLPSGSPN